MLARKLEVEKLHNLLPKKANQSHILGFFNHIGPGHRLILSAAGLCKQIAGD